MCLLVNAFVSYEDADRDVIEGVVSASVGFVDGYLELRAPVKDSCRSDICFSDLQRSNLPVEERDVDVEVYASHAEKIETTKGC